MQRFGQLIGVKPERLEDYKRLSCGGLARRVEDDHRVQHPQLLNFRKGPPAVRAYFEYVGEDFAADMAKMAADPETQRWWDVQMPCQAPIPTRAEGEWWATMEEVFHYD